MLKFFKTVRSRDISRGYFSYITESILDMCNVKLNYPNDEFKIYFDLGNTIAYGTNNIYDVCFTQDENDFIHNKGEYVNIEGVGNLGLINIYDDLTFTNEHRKICELVIKNHLIFNDEMIQLMSDRHSQINFNKTIGVHRRATDMSRIHNVPKIELNEYFKRIEKSDEFENVFLMCDNIHDLKKFKDRYGNRLITYDELTTSESEEVPFFNTVNTVNDKELIRGHIKEIVFGAYTLGMSKKLICTQSNLSAFSILSNHSLNYDKLN
jgi:hypothetical protein